jgi:uncharacterized protein (DUF1778 family)
MAIQNITINFDKETHAKVRRAAALLGVSVHQFVLESADVRSYWILDAAEGAGATDGAETESVD